MCVALSSPLMPVNIYYMSDNWPSRCAMLTTKTVELEKLTRLCEHIYWVKWDHTRSQEWSKKMERTHYAFWRKPQTGLGIDLLSQSTCSASKKDLFLCFIAIQILNQISESNKFVTEKNKYNTKIQLFEKPGLSLCVDFFSHSRLYMAFLKSIDQWDVVVLNSKRVRQTNEVEYLDVLSTN